LDSGLKRRLFIAVIIIALAVIFLPVPFGHLHYTGIGGPSQTIPSAPEQPVVTPLTAEQNSAVIAGFTPLTSTNNTNTNTTLNANHVTVEGSVVNNNSVTVSNSSRNINQQQTNNAPLPVNAEMSSQAASLPEDNNFQESNLIKVPKHSLHHLLSKSRLLKLKHLALLNSNETNQSASINASAVTVDNDSSPDYSPVVNQLNQGEQKPVYITQSALSSVLPKLHIRKINFDSSNIETEKNVENNLSVATAMNKAWVIQLGSFPDPAKTNQVIKMLRSKGYAAFSYEKVVNGQLMYRVYVGPFLQQAQAKTMLDTIEKTFNLSGYVHSFQATKLD